MFLILDFLGSQRPVLWASVVASHSCTVCMLLSLSKNRRMQQKCTTPGSTKAHSSTTAD
jgi:hypothetical protein